MMFRKPHLKKPRETAMSLVIAAVEGRPNPLDDPELAAVDPATTSLDLPDCRFDGGFDASFRTPAKLAK